MELLTQLQTGPKRTNQSRKCDGEYKWSRGDRNFGFTPEVRGFRLREYRITGYEEDRLKNLMPRLRTIRTVRYEKMSKHAKGTAKIIASELFLKSTLTSDCFLDESGNITGSLTVKQGSDTIVCKVENGEVTKIEEVKQAGEKVNVTAGQRAQKLASVKTLLDVHARNSQHNIIPSKLDFDFCEGQMSRGESMPRTGTRSPSPQAFL